MSNAASLAAAKKRRTQQPAIQFQQQQQQQQSCKKPVENSMLNSTTNNTPTTPINLLKRHDYRIFCLEKMLENNNIGQFSNNETQDFITKNDFELFKLENSITSKIDNKITNKVDNNSNELLALKTTVTQLNKSVGEMNGIIQMLKATVLSQTNELSELRDTLAHFFEQEKNEEQAEEQVTEQAEEQVTEQAEEQNKEDSNVDENSVKLNINEKS